MEVKKISTELADIIDNSINNIKISEKLSLLYKKNIIIYGAGYSGKFVCDMLKKNKLKPLCFLDQNADTLGECMGIPIKTAENNGLSSDIIENSIVILCVLSTKETQILITNKLKKLGFNDIILYNQKAYSNDFIEINKIKYSEPIIKDFKDRILSCLNLFVEKESADNFACLMKAFVSREYDHLSYISNECQYFPKNIALTKGYSRFIDCGAFDGDTIRNLLKIKGVPEAIYAFEPNKYNFDNLSKTIDFADIDNCCLFPCGVSQGTGTVRFSYDETHSGLASSIDENGNEMIQCVCLDDVIKGVSPTFIKMDIEGAEYGALLGAKKLIEKYKPDLAISVYHYFDHYFEIPLLINGWNLGYKFYLRTYDKCGNETVLYATCER